MSVTLQPTTGKLQIATINGGGFTTTPGNTDWGNTFDSDYFPSGSTAFPTVGSTYTSISGVGLDSSRRGNHAGQEQRLLFRSEAGRFPSDSEPT